MYDQFKVVVEFDEVPGVEGRVEERVLAPVVVVVDVMGHQRFYPVCALGPVAKLLKVLPQVMAQSLQRLLLSIGTGTGHGELLPRPARALPVRRLLVAPAP